MHVIHFIAVKANSKEEAFDVVQGELENESHIASDWSDWNVVGGGRWNSNNSQYDNDDSDIISYDEEPKKFVEALAQAREWKIQSLKWALDNFKPDEMLQAADRFINNNGMHLHQSDQFSMNYFYAKNIADMLSGHYNSDSHYYDIYNHTTNMEYVMDNPQGFYLIPVDFHH
jgi:hypothetical protein